MIKWIKNNKIVSIILITGTILLILSLITEYQNFERFFRLYLSANFFFLSICLSGLLLPSIHYILKAKWSTELIPYWFHLSKPLPVVIFTFFLLFIGFHIIFPLKSISGNWFNNLFFNHNYYFQAARTVLIFTIFLYFYFRMTGNFINKNIGAEKRKISISFIIIFFLIFPILLYDWMPGSIPAWHNSIYVFYHISGLMSGGLASVIIMIYFRNENGKEILHKISDKTGRYLLAVITFWFYIWFSQLLIIWYAGIPTESNFFLSFMKGTGLILFILNLILNFIVPMLVLIVRKLRTNIRIIFIISLIIISGRWLDYFLFAFPHNDNIIIHFGMMEAASVILTSGLLFLMLKQRAAEHI